MELYERFLSVVIKFVRNMAFYKMFDYAFFKKCVIAILLFTLWIVSLFKVVVMGNIYYVAINVLYAFAMFLNDEYDLMTKYNNELNMDRIELGDDPLQKSSVKNVEEKCDVVAKIGNTELFSTELIETGALHDNGSNMAAVSKVNAKKCTVKIEKNYVKIVTKIEEAEMQPELLTKALPEFVEKESFISNEKSQTRFIPKKCFSQGDGFVWLTDAEVDSTRVMKSSSQIEVGTIIM